VYDTLCFIILNKHLLAWVFDLYKQLLVLTTTWVFMLVISMAN